MLRIGGKPGQWCCRRQTEMCPLPGHLFSYLDLVLTSALGFPSIDPACGLRLWKPPSKKARNHLFSIISNNQKNRLAQFCHLLPPFRSWTSVGGLGWGWTWCQIWYLDIVQLRSFPSSITSESIVDSPSLTVQVCISASCPGCSGLQWQCMASQLVLSEPAVAQSQPQDTRNTRWISCCVALYDTVLTDGAHSLEAHQGTHGRLSVARPSPWGWTFKPSIEVRGHPRGFSSWEFYFLNMAFILIYKILCCRAEFSFAPTVTWSHSTYCCRWAVMLSFDTKWSIVVLKVELMYF